MVWKEFTNKACVSFSLVQSFRSEHYILWHWIEQYKIGAWIQLSLMFYGDLSYIMSYIIYVFMIYIDIYQTNI